MSKRELEVRTGHRDQDLGIRCRRPERLAGLTLAGSLKSAERYEPSPEHVLSEMMVTLDVEAGVTNFVDLGCGKGRIVCQASLHPFNHVVGVEFARELVEAAQENLQRMQKYVRARKVTFEWTDAARYRFEPGPRIVYLYNPFGAPILRHVLLQLRQAEGPTTLLYYEPVHARIIEEDGHLVLREAHARWSMFETASEPG